MYQPNRKKKVRSFTIAARGFTASVTPTPKEGAFGPWSFDCDLYVGCDYRILRFNGIGFNRIKEIRSYVRKQIKNAAQTSPVSVWKKMGVI